MELLMLNNPILKDSQMISISLFRNNNLLFLHAEFHQLMRHIPILNLNHIFLVLVNSTQQLSLDLHEMLTHLVFVEETCLFLEDKVYINTSSYLKESTLVRCFSFSLLNSNGFLLNCLYDPATFLSSRPICYHEQYGPRKESILHEASTPLSKY